MWRWWSEHTCRGSPCVCVRTSFTGAPPPAILARLSHPHTVADGACFLCTNQGGIRSLTDMSPMTPASIHINYSSSVRWMLPRVGRKRRGGRNRGRWKREITHSSSRHAKVLLTSACPPTRPCPPQDCREGHYASNSPERDIWEFGVEGVLLDERRKKTLARKNKKNSKSHIKCPWKSMFCFLQLINVYK